MADPAVMVLEQIDAGGERLAVVLSGSSMPNKGPSSTTTQREETTYLPGAAEPIVQILGPKLEPIVLAGQFNDSLLGEGGTAALVGALHKMTLAGVPVVLTWGDFWERRGLITDFTPSPLNEDLVDWQLTFKPHTLEDPIVTRPKPRKSESVAASADKSSRDANAESAKLKATQSNVRTSTLGAL